MATSNPPTQLSITASRPERNQASHLELEHLGFERSCTRARPSVAFIEAVQANPRFLQALSAQEILSIKCVSKPWATWFADNIDTIAHARREDESVDWYFPLLDKVDVPSGIWQMSGMWHGDAEYSSQSKLRKLPGTDYMQPASTLNTCVCHYSCKKMKHFVGPLMASGGGLLLFKTGADGSQGGHIDHSTECVKYYGKWSRSLNHLMVTNPLTKLWKDLPASPRPTYRYRRSNYNHDHFITVDDKINTYKVLIFWGSQLDVYDSWSNSWQSFGDILTGVQPLLGHWSTAEPKEVFHSAVGMDGRLYLAGIRKATHMETCSHRDVIGAIRLFEVDIETGKSKLCREVLLSRVFHDTQVHLLSEHALRILLNLELVESMGQLYAVIPARLNKFFTKPSLNPNGWTPRIYLSCPFSSIFFV